jgi:hypothetical protein
LFPFQRQHLDENIGLTEQITHLCSLHRGLELLAFLKRSIVSFNSMPRAVLRRALTAAIEDASGCLSRGERTRPLVIVMEMPRYHPETSAFVDAVVKRFVVVEPPHLDRLLLFRFR